MRTGLVVGAFLLLSASTALAGNTNFTGDDWTSRWQYDWTCWDLSMPTGVSATEIEMNTSGGTGDVDLKLYNGYGHSWGPASADGSETGTPFCSKASYSNAEDCTAELQTQYSYGNRQFTICVKGYNATNNVAVNGGYKTGTGGTNTTGNPNPTYYYVAYYRDLLFWPAYHREFCLISYNNGVGYVESDQDYDGFSDQDYCRKGEDWFNGPKAHEGDYQSSTYLGTSWATVKAKADNCGQWTNLMHGHDTTNKTLYLRRPPAVSYNLLTDNNSDCWAQDFAQCMGMGTISIVAPGCVDEAHPAY